MIIRKIFILAIIALTICEDNDTQTPPEGQQNVSKKGLTSQQVIKNEQLAKKHEAKLYKGVFQQHSFKISKYAEFIIIPQADQMVMVTVDVLWKQKDLYLLAPVQKNEEVHLVVSQLNKPIFNESFYTMTGFKFKASQKKVYKIAFTQSGNQEKMILLKVSEKLKTPKKAAKKDSMKAIQETLLYSEGKLQNALSNIKTGQILDQQILRYVLHQSSAYSHFQVLQSFIVVLISCLQVMFVTKMLKNDSII